MQVTLPIALADRDTYHPLLTLLLLRRGLQQADWETDLVIKPVFSIHRQANATTTTVLTDHRGPLQSCFGDYCVDLPAFVADTWRHSAIREVVRQTAMLDIDMLAFERYVPRFVAECLLPNPIPDLDSCSLGITSIDSMIFGLELGRILMAENPFTSKSSLEGQVMASELAGSQGLRSITVNGLPLEVAFYHQGLVDGQTVIEAVCSLVESAACQATTKAAILKRVDASYSALFAYDYPFAGLYLTFIICGAVASYLVSANDAGLLLHPADALSIR